MGHLLVSMPSVENTFYLKHMPGRARLCGIQPKLFMEYLNDYYFSSFIWLDTLSTIPISISRNSTDVPP